MGARTLTTLRVDGVPVARCVDGSEVTPKLGARPYLHPVRTLDGTVVTDAEPADHPWHLGLSVALQDVDGWNFWGGPTYLPGKGYVARDDHGRIHHAGFSSMDDGHFTQQLRWSTGHGEVLLTEERRVTAGPAGRGWQLEVGTTLRNAVDRPLRLGSPGTNGRPGAGYGGLFWRLPRAGKPHVRTPAGAGEQAVHDSPAPWLAWTDRRLGFTVVLAPADETTRLDPWFVRVEEYPGVGSQIAARAPLTLPPGGSARRGLRALLVDGVLDDGEARAWVEAE